MEHVADPTAVIARVRAGGLRTVTATLGLLALIARVI
jgi:hypothetical protein